MNVSHQRDLALQKLLNAQHWRWRSGHGRPHVIAPLVLEAVLALAGLLDDAATPGAFDVTAPSTVLLEQRIRFLFTERGLPAAGVGVPLAAAVGAPFVVA